MIFTFDAIQLFVGMYDSSFDSITIGILLNIRKMIDKWLSELTS